ncbi:MAG: hypothetical protein AAF545_04830 [Pseudomonadota bacterium]
MAENPTGATRTRSGCRALAGGLICTVMAACGGGGGSAPQVATPVAADIARDLELAALAYSTDQRTPSGFYSEAVRYPDRSEFRFHIKSDDLGVAAPLAFEMCSDDFNEALQWSEAGADARDFDTMLTGNAETDWFFEFDRAVIDVQPAVVINRVFKCSALDRAGLAPDGYAGQLMMRPLGADELRFVAEYLWQYSIYNNALNAVSASVPGTEAGALVHDLERVEVLVGDGQASGCDRVEVWTWRWTADPTTGALTSEQRFERAFDARFENATAQLCGS